MHVGGPQNAFNLLIYTNKIITIRQHSNSRDLLLLNVAARAGRCHSKESSRVRIIVLLSQETVDFRCVKDTMVYTRNNCGSFLDPPSHTNINHNRIVLLYFRLLCLSDYTVITKTLGTVKKLVVVALSPSSSLLILLLL
jgi:hypothetical protein